VSYLCYEALIVGEGCNCWIIELCPENLYLYVQDYFNIIKNPMDLSRMKKKLDEGLYSNPWEFVDDMWLMFNNAWLYNRKTSKVYKFCTKVSV